MQKVILIFVGSGLGGVLRYWLGGLVQAWWGTAFPLGTMLVNISGCFVIGFLATLIHGPLLSRHADELKAALLIGVLGGYTTFSSFGLETLALLRDGEYARAGLYVVVSVMVGLAAVWAGAAIAGKMYGSGAT